MEHPVREIASVITALTTGSPTEQSSTLETYFLPDAAFYHPFCRVPSFRRGTLPLLANVDSRAVVRCIYRWYRTLSPKVDVSVDSAVFDQRTSQLFVTVHQTFAIWFIPLYRAPVRLVTVLQLVHRHPSSVAAYSSSHSTISNSSSSSSSSSTSSTSATAVSIDPLGPGPDGPLQPPAEPPPSSSSRYRYYIASQEDLYPFIDCVQFVFPVVGPTLWFAWQIFATLLCVLGSTLLLPLYFYLNRHASAKKVH